MEFSAVIKELSLEDYSDALKVCWDESESIFDSAGLFSAKVVAENARLAGIDDDAVAHIVDVANKVVGSPALQRLIVHIYYLLFICDEPLGADGDLPEMEDVFGEEGYAYNLLLAVSGGRVAQKYFDDLNMPQDVADGAIKDISLWVSHYRKNLGMIGLPTRILLWERGLFKGALYRLGRLQFGILPFEGKVVVFRSKKTNQVRVLVDDGVVINSSGQFDGVDGVFDTAGAWTSRLVRIDNQIVGYPVSLLGNVQHKTLCLNASEWDEVLAPGDLILDTHIPAGGNFNIESCAQALDYSMEFFAKYFPDKCFKGWACHSWFLDNQYDAILPQHSNILKFQRELHLYPIDEGGEDSYWRIFGENGMKDGVENAPRYSSMQKAVAEFIEQGGRLRSGGGFLLKDDIGKWGSLT